MAKRRKVYKFLGINDQHERVRGEVSAQNSLDAIKVLRLELNIITILDVRELKSTIFDFSKLLNSKKKLAELNQDIRKVVKVKQRETKKAKENKTAENISNKFNKILSVLQNKRVVVLNDAEMEQAVQIAKESIFKSIEIENVNQSTANRSAWVAPSEVPTGGVQTVETVQKQEPIIQKVVVENDSSSKYAQVAKTTYANDGIGGALKDRLEQNKNNENAIKLDWSIVNKTKPKATAKIKTKELVLFSHKMGILLHSGILLLDALYIVKDSFKRKIVCNTIGSIIEKVQGGESLSEAMKEYPAMFDEFYVSVVTVGEAVGSMASTFNDLTSYYKIRLGIQKKAKTASIYPVITLSVLTLMLLGASKFFLPQFKDLFKSAGIPLPGITKFLFSVSDAIPNIMLAVFITLVLHLILYNTLGTYNKYLRIGIGWVMANAPVAKKYTQIMSLYNFSSTMQIMLKNGISLLDSLELGTHVIQNYIYKVQIASLKSCVIDGMSFAESAGYLKRLDQFTTSMIRIGEESGNLANAFQNINEYQQEALKEYTDNMVEMMQPIMMLLLAAIAIPVILGIYLPLMSMSSGNGVKI